MNSALLPSGTQAGAPAVRWLALALTISVLVGSVASFVGWVVDSELLRDWWGTGITIKANTSLALMCASMALLAAVLKPVLRSTVLALGLFVFLLGVLTLIEHLTDVDFGIDTLLFDEPPGALATAAPGRMGPPAAASFAAIGLALSLHGRGDRARRWGVGLAITVLTIAVLSLTGYVYGAEAMYTIPKMTGIALQTAIMLAALGSALILSLPAHEPLKTLLDSGEAGRLARRLLPAALMVPLTLGWLRVWGQRAGLYDLAFGTALRTVIEVCLFAGVFWWSVHAIRVRELRRLRAEAERVSSEARMVLVLEASAVPFIILTPLRGGKGAIEDFAWKYLNAASEKVLDRDAGKLVGKPVSDMFPGIWSDQSLLDAHIAVVARAEVREFETQFSSRGAQRWFRAIASPLEGDVAVWFADVTERKERESELRAADRRKDEYLATLAHELRNPLAPIRNAAAIIGREEVTSSQRRWCHEVISRQVHHMGLLLDDLLDVSRITRGKLEIHKTPTPLATLIEMAVETSRPLIDAKRQELDVQLPRAQVIVEVDSLRLAQVISNLLNNAAKYTPAEGTISIAAEAVEHELTIHVSDTGVGIAAGDLGRLFQMFSQIRPSQDASDGGLGIGLALAKGLVELHGGTITALSAGIGTGSTFVVRIPMSA
jgi:signal transduction histidine kinase